MKRLLPIIIIIFYTLRGCFAQSIGSYVYLETIKGLPCRVLLNKVELPDLAKSYYLFTLNQKGENSIDIIFGAGLYPKQNFVIDAAEHSAYGFKLSKTQDDKFYLIDLVNKGKIVELNTDVNLALSTEDNKIRYFDPNNLPVDIASVPKTNNKKPLGNIQTAKTIDKKPDNIGKTSTYGIISIIEPQAKENPSLTNTKKADNTKSNILEKPKPRAVCKLMSSEEEVSSAIQILNAKRDDETRLIVLKRKSFTGCLTTEQVAALAQTFDNQFDRFNAIKFLSRLISDYEKIPVLQNLFKNDTYKKKILEL